MSASSSSPSSGGATAARCRHFGECGGCALQHLSYEEQLEGKRQKVNGCLAPLGCEVASAQASPETWFYRNKMEFSFGDVYPPVEGGPALKLGQKAKGRWWHVLDLQECFLLSEEAPKLLASVRAWAEREKLAPFNAKRHTGFLRHLVVREGKNTGERLVDLVTAAGDFPAESFVEAVASSYPATTILRGVNAKVSDTAVSDALTALTGPGYIHEELRVGPRRRRFRISPHSFFQTNTRGAERLYGLVRAWLEPERPKRLLDLYCGAGSIGLCLADVCGEVVGAELNPSAVADAKLNASLNDAPNVSFYQGAVETLLPSLLALAPDAIVVDPPRAGLHSTATGLLLEVRAPTLVYVSCNPEALARDLALLQEGYAVERAEVVDLFPHTEHVETAVLLRRK